MRERSDDSRFGMADLSETERLRRRALMLARARRKSRSRWRSRDEQIILALRSTRVLLSELIEQLEKEAA